MINYLIWLVSSTSVAITSSLLLRKILKNHIREGYLMILWLPILLQLAIPITFTSSLSIYKLDRLFPIDTYETMRGTEYSADVTQLESQPSDIVTRNPIKLFTMSSTNSNTSILVVWSLGFSVSLLLLAIKMITFRKFLRIQHSVSQDTIEIVNQLKKKFRAENLEIIYTPIIQTSALYGFWKPKLLISNHLDEMNEQQIKMMITHELIHYCNRHYFMSGFLFILQAVYWFHPLLPLMIRKIKQDLEVFTDAQVIKQTNYNKKEYGYLLVLAQHDQRNILLDGFKANRNLREMKERIDQLMGKKQSRAMAGVLVIMTLVTAVVFLTKPKTGNKESIYDFMVPIKNASVTCNYGCYDGHEAIDMVNRDDVNGNIYATADGIVLENGYHEKEGYYLKIDHGEGITSIYRHMNEASFLEEDCIVMQGDVIGRLGSSGFVTGPHLHFAIMIDGKYADPRLFITLP